MQVYETMPQLDMSSNYESQPLMQPEQESPFIEQAQAQTPKQIASITRQIDNERNEAKLLYREILNVKQRTQDATIQTISQNVTKIPKNSCNLTLYNTLKGHQNKIAKLCWSSDSSKILSASQDGYMIIWDAITGFKKHAIQLENPWVLTCSYSANEKLVASGGLDNNCTIYKIKPDTSNFPVLEERTLANSNSYQMQGSFYQSVESVFKGHTAYISECEFLGNNSVITASGDMTCALWDLNKGSKGRDFVEHAGDVLCLDIFPQNVLSDNLFISGSSDGSAKIWDLRSPTPTQSFSISNSDVNSVKVFPDGNAFATGSDDGQIRLFDLRSDCELGHYSLALDLRNSASLQHLTTLTPMSPAETSKGKFSNGYVHSGSVFNSSNRSSSGNMNASFDQYSVSSLRSVIENLGIFSLDFGKSGRFLYACYSDYGCVVWDTLKNETIGTIGNEHANKINQVSVSPDGIGLATGSWDATIKVWSV
ncbi:Guanine nucleotide-binding protein subunit beta [Candida viswanathii]|uniref:Guanine nucleotide-binding protein subunit beta n=1 Tax=Candida viswanathii TaxID=5486 RepID=A0A367XLN7_9ASCO|nr:Guanine nucleotide-binding protein subunit beta [Candida viswanathii]